MFWIQALLEVKVINVISTLFYLYRGLTLTQIFYTAIIFSAVSLLSEIPSSYLADRWGRKKVIILATLASLTYWAIYIFAWSYLAISIGIAFYAVAHALLSGTDEALIYDTTKELGQEKVSLKNLGKYYSARRVFKLVTPLIAVLIAHDLTNTQYILVLGIDVVATLTAFALSWFLVEPSHHIQVEELEAGVLKGAIKLIRGSKNLMNIMFNKSLLFIASFILWRVSSDYFTGIDIPLIFLGVATAIYQLGILLINLKVSTIFTQYSLEKRINLINIIATTLLLSFLALSYIPGTKWLLLIIFIIALIAEMVRWPLFSEIINKTSSSYNRATTISLTNFVKNVLDIPVYFLASYLIGKGYHQLFILVAILSLFPTIFFRLKQKTVN